MLRFVNSVDAPRLAELGTSCPDHFLRTKIKPLFVDWDPETGDVDALKAALRRRARAVPQGLRGLLRAVQARRTRRPCAIPNPTVVLIPGLGMIAWGKNKSESRVTAEFYNCAIEVMRGAEAIDEYEAMDQQEAFDIEYWLLEEAKLRRCRPRRSSTARSSSSSAPAPASARRRRTGWSRKARTSSASIVDEAAAQATAQEIIDEVRRGHRRGRHRHQQLRPGDRPRAATSPSATASRAMFDDVLLAYGGLDAVVVTAGIFVPPDTSGPHRRQPVGADLRDQRHRARTSWPTRRNKIFKRQGLPGNIVLTTSANAVVAKKGSLAYDTSKAAANHLVRELAVEMAPLVRVNAVAPATVVKGSTMFPRDRVIASLAKYGIAFERATSRPRRCATSWRISTRNAR